MMHWPQKLLLVACLMLMALGVQGGCSDEEDFESEGSLSSPLDLGTAPTTPYSGQVGSDTNSYYSASVSEDTDYTVSMSQLLDDADLAVFEDSGFTRSFCAAVNNGTTSEQCDDRTKIGIFTLYIQIKPFSDTGTSFLLSVQ